VSALDFDRTTLDPRDLSYEGQLAELEADGWELDDTGAGPGTLRYLRRHRRIAEIERVFVDKGRRLRYRREADGTWTGWFVPRPIGEDEMLDPDATGSTPLEVAESAVERFG
jgi:hypothetical protein